MLSICLQNIAISVPPKFIFYIFPSICSLSIIILYIYTATLLLIHQTRMIKCHIVYISMQLRGWTWIALQLMLFRIRVTHQLWAPHWEPQCPRWKEAVLCALWVGIGENSYALTWVLIGGSPPLGFGWDYAGEASRRRQAGRKKGHQQQK